MIKKLTITIKIHITDPDYLTDVRNIAPQLIADDFREDMEPCLRGYDFEVTAAEDIQP